MKGGIPMNVEHKEYASKGVAGTGLGLGIAGTALGLLNGGAGGNPIGGLFGGGCAGGAALAAKDAEIAKLKAEKYSDNAAKVEADRLLTHYLKPYGDEIAASRVREAAMQAEIDCLKQTTELKFRLAEKDVALVRQELACCCTTNASAVAQVQAILNSLTKVVVPNSSVCPGWTTTTTAAAAGT